MLHHQHPVHPIPRNQLRDSINLNNRMAHHQMSMRLPQPAGMGSQQRPPHPHNPHLTMGMQPQPNVPGVMVPMVPPVMTMPQQQQLQATPMQTAGSENEGTMMRMQGSAAAASATTTSTVVAPAAATPTSPSHATPQQQQQQSQPSSQQQQQQQGVTASTILPSTDSSADSEQQQNPASNLTNTKEKTPMCLINELARFNKVTHQYRLTSETGPAHKKRFTVTLKLGDEEYTAEGASIKKAQHSAAADALTSTHYEHPPPKTQRVLRVRKVNITPTVELNALAMKRGEPTAYNFLEPLPPTYPPNCFRGMSYQRYHYNKPMYGPAMFFVSLRVGEREYSGQGRTAQAARHDAASKALVELRQLPLPEGVVSNGQENGEQTESSTVKTTSTAATSASSSATAGATSDPGSDLKSPISLVHELALKRSLPVTFEVIREKGPPHMRTFLTTCTVGELVTEGEGNSKKTSKKRAAEQMLEELKKLPPISPPALNPQRLKRKPTAVKKKTRNLIKEQKVKQEYTDDINPISRLIQIQQAKKEREPEYSLIEERGVPRRREFVMEVTVGQHSCTGSGPNKKLAKRAAAEALLQLLGYSRPADAPANSAVQTGKAANDSSSTSQGATTTADKGRKVTFLEDTDTKEQQNNSGSGTGGLQPGGSGGRQLVPGLLLMTDTSAMPGFTGKGKSGKNGPTKGGPTTRQTAAVIAKELLNCGNSPTAEALVAAGHMQSSTHPPATTVVSTTATTPANNTQPPRPKELLNYLSNLLKLNVQYTDFPKVNHSEFLSLVSLSTNPPQVFHGAGPTTDASHDQAARTALQVLSELGLDAVNNPSDTQTSTESMPSSGEGLHLLGSSKSVVTSNGK